MADLACPLPFSAECPMLGSIPQALKESQAPLKLSPTLACSVLMVFSSSRRWRVKVSRGSATYHTPLARRNADREAPASVREDGTGHGGLTLKGWQEGARATSRSWANSGSMMA